MGVGLIRLGQKPDDALLSLVRLPLSAVFACTLSALRTFLNTIAAQLLNARLRYIMNAKASR